MLAGLGGRGGLGGGHVGAGAHVGDVSGKDVTREVTVAVGLRWRLKGLEHLLKLTEQERS